MSGTLERSGGSIGAAAARARVTGSPVTVSQNGTLYVISPNGQMTPTTNAGVSGTPQPASYTDPTTLQTFTAYPGSTTIVGSGPGYGNGTPIAATGPATPYDYPKPLYNMPPAAAANASRNYRAQHGLSTAADNSADALNAESLAAAQAGRTYFNRDLAAQYGATPTAGFVGPRTDVVNALQMPQTTAPAVMLAPTATQPVSQQQPINLMQYLPRQQQQPVTSSSPNPLLQGIY